MDRRKADYAANVKDWRYQPDKKELNKEVSVPVSPQRLAQAVMKGGTARQEPRKSDS